jgi:hypothetical protein
MQGIRDTSDMGTLLYNQNPTMQRGEELPAAAAALRDIKFQPELVKGSAAKFKNNVNTGMIPYATGIGDITGQGGLESATADRNEAYNRTMAADARKLTAPATARTGDEALIAQNQLHTAQATSALPGVPGVVQSEQGAAVAGNNLNKQQSLFNTQVSSMMNPQLAATAGNMGNQAAATKFGLETSSGGGLTPGWANQAVANPYLPPEFLRLIQQLATSSMTNRNAGPTVPAPTTPTTIVPRTKLPAGLTLPME